MFLLVTLSYSNHSRLCGLFGDLRGHLGMENRGSQTGFLRVTTEEKERPITHGRSEAGGVEEKPVRGYLLSGSLDMA